MSTDFYLVVGVDLLRLGYRGGTPTNFVWLVDDDEPALRRPDFEAWDDFGNSYTKAEFTQMLAGTEERFHPTRLGMQRCFPDGTNDPYWPVNKPVDGYCADYKRRVLALAGQRVLDGNPNNAGADSPRTGDKS